PHFDGSAISAIEISSRNPRLMYVGTTNGGVFRSNNRGRSWTSNLAGPAIPNRLISRIEAHPRQPGVVVLTTASTGAPGAFLCRDTSEHSRPYGHVFRSEDEGDTWTDIDN